MCAERKVARVAFRTARFLLTLALANKGFRLKTPHRKALQNFVKLRYYDTTERNFDFTSRFFFKPHFFNSLSHQHCKAAKKGVLPCVFFWNMPQYMMEFGAEIPWFYPMFVSSIKELNIRLIVMIVVSNYTKRCNRYTPFWFHEKSKFLMFQNAEVELLDG